MGGQAGSVSMCARRLRMRDVDRVNFTLIT